MTFLSGRKRCRKAVFRLNKCKNTHILVEAPLKIPFYWELFVSLYQNKILLYGIMKVEITDDDLRELIQNGANAGKYKKISRDKKFVRKLTDIYNLMRGVEHVSRLKDYSFLHYELALRAT